MYSNYNISNPIVLPEPPPVVSPSSFLIKFLPVLRAKLPSLTKAHSPARHASEKLSFSIPVEAANYEGNRAWLPLFQARPENGIPTVIPQMYLPGAHPRLKRDRRRAGTVEKEGTRPLTSPLPLIWYHARFVSAGSSRVSTYTYTPSPTPSLFIAETHTAHIVPRISVCAPQSCIGRSAHNNNAPQQTLVKRALYCCSRCSDAAASFLRPNARLLRLAPSPSARYPPILVPLPRRSHKPEDTHTARGSLAREDRTCATNYRFELFLVPFPTVVGERGQSIKGNNT